MSKDGPKSGRIAFGYEQAKKAGMPWEAVKPLSARQYNEIIRERHRRSDNQTKEVKLLQQYPELQQRVRELQRDGWTSETIIRQLKHEAKRHQPK